MRPKYKLGTLVKIQKDNQEEITEITGFYTNKDGFHYETADIEVVNESDIVQAYRAMPKKRRKSKKVENGN